MFEQALLSFDPTGPFATMWVNWASYLSLGLIFLAFGLIAVLSMRSRTVSSFQFELYVFVLVVVLAEVPKIAISLGYLPALAQYELDGLIVHSISMAFLSSFVLWRAFKAFGPRQVTKTKNAKAVPKNAEIVKKSPERKN